MLEGIIEVIDKAAKDKTANQFFQSNETKYDKHYFHTVPIQGRLMKFDYIFLFCIFGFLSGCVSAPPMELQNGAEKVLVAKSDPTNNYEIIGPVSGFDGEGCGLYGYLGSYERATTSLRNETLKMGGDYAQLISLIEPHSIGGCFHNEYALRATAYKKIGTSPTPTPIVVTGKDNNTKILRELKSLLDDGILSQTEFDNQKAKLLEKGF